MKLKDKVAIVTGSTSGIGQAVAIRYAKEGAKIALTGRNKDKLAEAERQIKAIGGECLAIPADLVQVLECQKVVDDTVAAFGRVDILFNSAGVAEFTPFFEVDEALYEKILQTNLKTQFFMCQKAALVMKKQNRGKIICMASIAGGTSGYPSLVAYGASKGGVYAMVMALAVELAPYQINVNTISPGNIETPMNDHLMADAAYKEKMVAITPLGRNGQTKDITPAAVYLACEDSDYMSGRQMVIDGGTSAS